MSRIQNRVQLGKLKWSVLREWGGGWQREKWGEWGGGGGLWRRDLKGLVVSCACTKHFLD